LKISVSLLKSILAEERAAPMTQAPQTAPLVTNLELRLHIARPQGGSIAPTPVAVPVANYHYGMRGKPHLITAMFGYRASVIAAPTGLSFT
jgi:hypothetical protein